MITRIAALKPSLVRILVGGQPAGTGFVAAPSGCVVTCFHVVQVVAAVPNQPQQIHVSVAQAIEVESNTGARFPATPHPNCLGNNLTNAITADFMVLQVPGLAAPGLRLASLAQTPEGTEIYVGGYPLAIAQPIVARGLLSSKWHAPSHLFNGQGRAVAWLDITMNRGNSGGPVVRVADTPDQDHVVGIATFVLNPFAQAMEQVIQVAQGFPGQAILAGINMGAFASLVGNALAANSLGVGGCVAIEYAKNVLP